MDLYLPYLNTLFLPTFFEFRLTGTGTSHLAADVDLLVSHLPGYFVIRLFFDIFTIFIIIISALSTGSSNNWPTLHPMGTGQNS